MAGSGHTCHGVCSVLSIYHGVSASSPRYCTGVGAAIQLGNLTGKKHVGLGYKLDSDVRLNTTGPKPTECWPILAVPQNALVAGAITTPGPLRKTHLQQDQFNLMFSITNLQHAATGPKELHLAKAHPLCGFLDFSDSRYLVPGPPVGGPALELEVQDHIQNHTTAVDPGRQQACPATTLSFTPPHSRARLLPASMLSRGRQITSRPHRRR